MFVLLVLAQTSLTAHLSSAVLPRRGRVRVAPSPSSCLEGGQVGGRAGVGQAQVLGLHARHLGGQGGQGGQEDQGGDSGQMGLCIYINLKVKAESV